MTHASETLQRFAAAFSTFQHDCGTAAAGDGRRHADHTCAGRPERGGAAAGPSEHRAAYSGGRPLDATRHRAMERFATMGLPTPQDEEWRGTRIAPLADTDFALAPPRTEAEPDRSAVERFLWNDFQGVQLVFVDGHFVPTLSRLPAAAGGGSDGRSQRRPQRLEPGTPRTVDGLTVMSLAAALARDDERVLAHLTRHAAYDSEPFTALNTAFLQDGAFIHLARGVVVEQPIQVLFVSTDAAQPTMTHPRLLVLAGEDARLVLVEVHAGLGPGPYLSNAVGEMVLGREARIDHVRIQREGAQAFHIDDLRVVEAAGARYRSTCVTLDGRLTRNHVHTELQGEGIDSRLQGLYLAGDRQHVDNHTLIEHQRPGCNSHEYYKGILTDRSSGVFRGKILVRPGAQRTDAYQANRNLLLSAAATVDSQPQLEIYADDVKCSHGTTVGELDPEALFYLRSRGVGLAAARRALIRAFAEEICALVEVEPVRRALTDLVRDQLSLLAR